MRASAFWMRKILNKKSDLWLGHRSDFYLVYGREMEWDQRLLLIALSNPITKNTALINKSDNNTMN